MRLTEQTNSQSSGVQGENGLVCRNDEQLIKDSVETTLVFTNSQKAHAMWKFLRCTKLVHSWSHTQLKQMFKDNSCREGTIWKHKKIWKQKKTFNSRIDESKQMRPIKTMIYYNLRLLSQRVSTLSLLVPRQEETSIEESENGRQRQTYRASTNLQTLTASIEGQEVVSLLKLVTDRKDFFPCEETKRLWCRGIAWNIVWTSQTRTDEQYVSFDCEHTLLSFSRFWVPRHATEWIFDPNYSFKLQTWRTSNTQRSKTENVGTDIEAECKQHSSLWMVKIACFHKFRTSGSVRGFILRSFRFIVENWTSEPLVWKFVLSKRFCFWIRIYARPFTQLQ